MGDILWTAYIDWTILIIDATILQRKYQTLAISLLNQKCVRNERNMVRARYSNTHTHTHGNAASRKVKGFKMCHKWTKHTNYLFVCQKHTGPEAATIEKSSINKSFVRFFFCCFFFSSLSFCVVCQHTNNMFIFRLI